MSDETADATRTNGAGTIVGAPAPPFAGNVTAAEFNERSRGRLPALLGIVIEDIRHGSVTARMPVREDLHAPNGYLHAASVIGLADTCAGAGCLASLPEGAVGFTTIELKSNFLGTARDGVLVGHATLAHGGRTTQVWDAEVRVEGNDRPIALFRCTQMILYPKPAAAQ